MPTSKARGCSIEGCSKRHLARGFCQAHYLRWYTHGDPLAGGTFKGEPMRFFIEVVLPHTGDDCLIWPFARGDRYAQMWLDGRVQLVHRAACERVNGPPPTPQHEAAHSCGNGASGCVNPLHTRWATPIENSADKAIHGTQPRGESHPDAKLTEAEVRSIRSLAGTITQTEIAEMFGVTRSSVSLIVRRKNWAWLDRPQTQGEAV